MDAQGKKLLDTLGFVVDHLDNPEKLIVAADHLATRHVEYGVVPEHYDLVGASLMWTFEHLLGPEFNETYREAWEAAYGVLTARMIETAYGTEA